MHEDGTKFRGRGLHLPNAVSCTSSSNLYAKKALEATGRHPKCSSSYTVELLRMNQRKLNRIARERQTCHDRKLVR
ncbi:hypothetical protein ACTXT7_010082 [Hymenolepis weldensis]